MLFRSREERPDIDDIYQKVCQIATGQGGWPLSIFLTPDQKPFYAGTYFPVLDSYGRPGFGSICRQLSQSWNEKPKDIEKSAEKFLSTLQKAEKITVPSKLERVLLDEAALNLFQLGDSAYGGFGSAPNFLMLQMFHFCLIMQNFQDTQNSLNLGSKLSKKWQMVEFLIKSEVAFTDIQLMQNGLFLILKKCFMTMH
mgnify:CR=1 FL=1